MLVLRWIFVALAVLSLAGSFVSLTLANGALRDNDQKKYTKNQLEALVGGVAGVAWGVLAVAMSVGESASKRHYRVQPPGPQQMYGAPPYPPQQQYGQPSYPQQG
jgi:hypothetical protein